jgi:hypothetical protein
MTTQGGAAATAEKPFPEYFLVDGDPSRRSVHGIAQIKQDMAAVLFDQFLSAGR